MKFLLAALNAKYIHSNLAIYSLRAYCPEYRENIELAEYTINDDPWHILGDIFRRRPDALAFSCYIWNIREVELLIEEIYKVLPETELWLGGPEASCRAEELLIKHPHLRGIMAGEGERTFRQLMEHYCLGTRQLGKVQSLLWRDGDRLCRNPQGEPLSLSDLPFPYEDGNIKDFENRIVYYESSRGCPFSCSYCLSSIDKRLRFRELSLVKRELQFFLDRRTAQVKFVDRTFNVWHEHAVEIWRYIMEHDNGITNFHFEISADLLTEEELVLLGQMRPGLLQFEIGVQSTNAETVREIRRQARTDRIRQAVEVLCRGRNIHIHLDLIAGLPCEDYESFCRSFNEVYAMQPDNLQLGFLKVLPGTEMAERAEEYGLVYQSVPNYEVLSTKWISYGELLLLKDVEDMVEVYYNSAQFTASIKLLLTYFKTPYDMYEALAEYYRGGRLAGRKQNRLERYEILLSFAEGFLRQEDREYFRECLVYDLYLRENRKSRPNFAGEPGKYKESISAFYKTEASERRYLPDYEGFDGKQLARQTHLEHFTWNPVTGTQQEVFLLFDYRRRDPLSLGAAVTEIREGEFYSYAGI